MLFLKRGLTAIGALALAAILLNLVAPKAAHALVATAVQVMNTSATPVMTRDVDAAARNVLYLHCDEGTSSCTTAAVPSGSTFVLDSISLYAHFAAAPVYRCYVWIVYPPPYYKELYWVPLTPDGMGGASAATNLTAYAAGGTSINLQCPPAVDGASGTFAGHLVPSP